MQDVQVLQVKNDFMAYATFHRPRLAMSTREGGEGGGGGHSLYKHG